MGAMKNGNFKVHSNKDDLEEEKIDFKKHQKIQVIGEIRFFFEFHRHQYIKS